MQGPLGRGERARTSGRLRAAAIALVAASSVGVSPRAGAGEGQTNAVATSPRTTAETPEAMLVLARERASGAEPDAVAGLLLLGALREDVAPDAVPRAVRELVRSGGPLAVEAQGFEEWLRPSPFGTAWSGFASARVDVGPQSNGLVRAFQLTGPFPDRGGGLLRSEGPEANTRGFADVTADYSWGTMRVAPRRSLVESTTAQGLPLDLYVAPRADSCTYLASKVTLATKAPSVVLRVASTGAVRVLWDGTSVVHDEEVHARAVLDRLAVRVDASPGPHLLVVKVCSSPLADEGRVRARFTDDTGKPIAVEATSDLAGFSPRNAAPANAAARVETALERARRATESPDRAEALRSALVRTLAGADDLRSPRTPGLLDRVARDPAVTTDELATAGWLSAFGANRSGWLGLARERALREGDSSCAAFATRRLVEGHLERGALDTARATIEGDPLATAGDPEARVLRAKLTAPLGIPATSIAALEALSRIDGELGARTPIAVLRELANLASAKPELQLGYQRRLAQLTASARGAPLVVAAAVESAASLERTAALVVPHVANTDLLLSLGDGLLRLGRYAWAREVFYTAATLSPNRPEAWLGLANARDAVVADERARGVPPTDDPAFALAARQRAAELRRGDPTIKAELGFRRPMTSEPAVDAPDEVSAAQGELEDERYLASSATILARAKAAPARVGEVFDRVLHFQRVVTYHPDRRVSQLIHQAREIVVEPRTENERFERNIDAEGDRFELVLARVHRADGTIVEPEEQNAAGAYIKWPELRRGDVVEYAFRSWTSQPVGGRGDVPFYFIDYVGSTTTHPVLFNEVVVQLPKGASFGVDVVGGAPDATSDAIEGTTRTIRHTWTKPPVIADEPLAPNASETLPVVVGSTFESWDAFRAWYREAIRGMTEPDEQIRRLAADLTKGAKTERDKIAALFDFVADDIRYVNFVSGESWLPNRPQQCLARRQGDCDDKAILLIALLRSIGVEATPVLVQTRMTAMPRILSAKTAAAPLFDHGIAFLPGRDLSRGDGKQAAATKAKPATGDDVPGTWLDATSPQSRLGPLPSMDARARALFVEVGEARIRETPTSDPSDHGVRTRWDVTLAADGSARVVGNEDHDGDWAFEVRGTLTEPDARGQWVEQYLAARWLSSVELTGPVDFEPRDGTLRYEARAEGFARREGEELTLQPLARHAWTTQLAPLATRTLPVVLPAQFAPSHQERTIRVTIPAGYELAALPPGGEAKGGVFGRASVTFKAEPRGVVAIRSDLVFEQSTIAPSDYPAFRAWLQSVDALSRQSIRLAPKAARTAAKR
jgi:transglutaminase-like putative cysteine protease